MIVGIMVLKLKLKPMNNIKKLIRNKAQFDYFLEILLNRIKNNQPISDNPMLDGMIISFIAYNGFALDLILNKEMGHVLDGSLQQLEQIVIWMCNNESKLCEILNINSNPHLLTLKELSELKPNWDNNGAKAISIKVINKAKTLVKQLIKLGQLIYNIAPGPNGEVMVVLKKGEKSLEINFYKTHSTIVFFLNEGNWQMLNWQSLIINIV